MNKRIISESKVRSIVRNELKNYLVQEGILDNLKAIGSDIKNTFNNARQQSVFRKSATSGPLLTDLNYLQVVNADGIANLVDQLSTTIGVDSTDPLKILDQLLKLITNKSAQQDTDLKLDESKRSKKEAAKKAAEKKEAARRAAEKKEAAPNDSSSPEKKEPAKPSPTDIETLTKLYRISASRETDLFNELKGKKPEDLDLNIKGQYIEYAICKMIIQNLINPALGTDILSKNQIKKINNIIDIVKTAFETAKRRPGATTVEVEDDDDPT